MARTKKRIPDSRIRPVSGPAGTSRLHFAQGPALIKIISDDYRTMTASILEYIQNPIDADATRVDVFINMKTRNVTIEDNGEGVSLDVFRGVMSNVMQSVKKHRRKYGKFGEGVYSALGKCEWFKFISCPQDGTTYTEFTFDTERIRSQTESIEIEHVERPDLQFGGVGRRGITPVNFRTKVEIHSFTDDRHIGHIPSASEIFDAACERYREIMLANNVLLSILIAREDGHHDKREGHAEPYSGEVLPEVSHTNDGGGKTTFHILLAKKDPHKGFRGKVAVGEAGGASRVPFRLFARGISGGLLSAETIAALNSGIFEGDILSEQAKIHPDRRSFVEDEALMGLCLAIEDWYVNVGKLHYESAIDEKDADNLRKLGEELVRNVEPIFKDPRLADILKRITDGIKLQTKVPDPDGDEEMGGTPRSESGGGGGGGGSSGPKTDKKKRRARVESQTLGITISYDGEYQTKALYYFDPASATLYFNRRHPQWAACEKNGAIGREIKQLQEYVMVQVLAEQLVPEYAREGAGQLAAQALEFFVLLIKSSPSFLHLSGTRKLAGAKK